MRAIPKRKLQKTAAANISPDMLQVQPVTEPSRRASGVKMGLLRSYHSSFADFHENYVSRQVGLADTKATVVLGITVSVLAYFASRSTYHGLLKSGVSDVDWIAFSFCLAIVAFTLSAGLAAYVIIPRLGRAAPGVVFFMDVAGNYKEGTEYTEALIAMTESQLTAARLQHCHDLAVVCTRKFRWLRASMICAAVGFVASLLPLHVVQIAEVTAPVADTAAITKPGVTPPPVVEVLVPEGVAP